jgi:dGTPase
LKKGKYSSQTLDGLRRIMDANERRVLSDRATPSEQGFRRINEADLEHGYRQAFAVDVDRILHARAYTRYIDKTQVFYLIENDHITHRVLHVQLVSKIARTVGRFLGLNEDLIEAIALGHDIGHAPFGHDGERFLSELCVENGIGHFVHSVQGLQFLDRVERKGRGWNLCLHTLDGILCHDGEVHDLALCPEKGKTFDTLWAEMRQKTFDPARPLVPMTLEGCVMRMSDTIAYIGRDIEDAIRLNMIRRSDLPGDAVEVLGDTNGSIVYTLVTDLIQNSHDKPCISFSPEVAAALKRLKGFNYEHIYLNPLIKQHTKSLKRMFNKLYGTYLNDIKKQNHDSAIFKGFLDRMSPDYLERHQPAEIVRDFVAGMTDRFFLSQFPRHERPQTVRIK